MSALLNSSRSRPWDSKLAKTGAVSSTEEITMQNWKLCTHTQKKSHLLYLANDSTQSSNSGAKHSSHWALCVTVSVRTQEMCSIRSGPYVAFWWRSVFLWIHKWRYASLETKSLFACVYTCVFLVCVCARERASESERDCERECAAEVHHSCSVYRRWHRGGSPRAEQSVCRRATAVAICTANWASPRERVALSRPIWNATCLCQPRVATSSVLD